MNGQLNSNIYNASSSEDIEELQQEIDSINASVDSLNDKIDETNTALDDYKKANKTQVSTADIKSDSATITNLSSNAIKGNTLCITGTSNLNDINADDINAKGNIEAVSISAPSITATKLNADNGDITTLKAIDATITNANAVNIKGSSISITGKSILGDITASDITSSTLTADTVKGKIVSTKINTDNAEITSLTANVITSPEANITKTVSKDMKSDTATIGGITATNETVDNLTVNKTLTIASGITLPNTLGDTKLSKVTTDSLIVNGDSELNGAVKAGSITVPDGAITAGEVCIGAKGVVIDKDKNAAFADISSSNITAENIDVNTKITASCVEAKDVVSTNTFACNFYPENITIDKDVGVLHYSRQLDTDDEGGVLVDCKNVKVKTNKCSIDPVYTYRDFETNITASSEQIYTNTKNGITVQSKGSRKQGCCEDDFYDNQLCFINDHDWVRGSDEGIKIASCKIVPTSGDTVNSLEVAAYNTLNQCYYPFLQLKCNSAGTYLCSAADHTEIKGDLKIPNISICKTTDNNKYALKVDSNGNLYQGIAGSSLIDNDCKCANNCSLMYSCVYQNPARFYDYTINYNNGSTFERAEYCFSTSGGQSYDQCCLSIIDDCNRRGCCVCSIINPSTFCDIRCNWCSSYDDYTNTKRECQVIERSAETFGCGKMDELSFYSCCSKADDICICRYYDVLCNLLGGRNNNCGLEASCFCRCVSEKPELSWQIRICDDDLYIENPRCYVTCEKDGKTFNKAEDILRVEDGKIYTKCGEFTSGGGSGYFEDANVCLNTKTATRTVNIPNGCITDKLTENKTAAVWGCCWCPYNCASSFVEYDNCECCVCYSTFALGNPASVVGCLCVYCKNSPSDYAKACWNTFGSYCVDYHMDGKYLTCCSNDRGYKSVINCNKDCIAYGLVYTYGFNSYNNAIDIGCIYCRINNCSCSVCGEIPFTGYYVPCSPVGYSKGCCICRKFEVPRSIMCYDYDLSLFCNCDCGDVDTLLCCYHFVNKPATLKYCESDIEVWWCNPNDMFEVLTVEYDNETCLYPTKNGYGLDTTNNGFYHQTICNGNTVTMDITGICYQSKVVDNPITALPITNTLVPLAGTVNGKGFAFFCKGADGVKFYDGSFATVDAGAATNITYLVTQGA